MNFVLDNSAAIEAMTRPRTLILPPGMLFAPELIDVEFLSTMRRLVKHGELSQERARGFIDAWQSSPVRRTEHAPLIDRAWEHRDTISAYDAFYVALAERLRLPLITADGRLARAASAHCEVVVLD